MKYIWVALLLGSMSVVAGEAVPAPGAGHVTDTVFAAFFRDHAVAAALGRRVDWNGEDGVPSFTQAGMSVAIKAVLVCATRERVRTGSVYPSAEELWLRNLSQTAEGLGDPGKEVGDGDVRGALVFLKRVYLGHWADERLRGGDAEVAAVTSGSAGIDVRGGEGESLELLRRMAVVRERLEGLNRRAYELAAEPGSEAKARELEILRSQRGKLTKIYDQYVEGRAQVLGQRSPDDVQLSIARQTVRRRATDQLVLLSVLTPLCKEEAYALRYR